MNFSLQNTTTRQTKCTVLGGVLAGQINRALKNII